jgi:glycosyltransferase involved in cell wall biosynthesis
MRVLLVAFALWHEIQQLAHYMPAAGLCPTLLTGAGVPAGHEGDPRRVAALDWVRSGWFDWPAAARRLWPAPAAPPGPARSPSRRERLGRGRFMISGSRLPDAFAGWIPHAVRAGAPLIAARDIDFILATGTPISAFLVGALLNARAGRPWLAEYRDPWTTGFWAVRPGWIDSLEAPIERRVLRSAGLITAVSAPLARDLGRLHRRPVAVVPLGFDHRAYERLTEPRLPDTPTLVYTGSMHPRRPLAPFFAALARLRPVAPPPGLRVRYVGPGGEEFAAAAARAGMADLVEVCGPVPPDRLPAIQRAATILLQLESTEPRAAIMMSIKLAEYLGARRPILAMGARGGAMDAILRRTGAGVLVSDEDELCAVLSRWLALYARGDRDVGLTFDDAAIRDYTYQRRAERFAALGRALLRRDRGDDG